MNYKNEDLLGLLLRIDLGSSIAEQDKLLQAARVETSAFSDLYMDKVDLIPGTKGSGKSALYRIFVEFLPKRLLKQHKVVIAHGVNHHGHSVFLVYKDHFDKLNEDDFVNFWCIYLISLIEEHFIKGSLYTDYIEMCKNEVEGFRRSCQQAGIPDIKGKKSLKDVLGWVLTILDKFKPNKVTYKLPSDGGELEFDFAKNLSKSSEKHEIENNLPLFVDKIRQNIEGILKKADLSIWLMIDRLDEIFQRRSQTERRALRGLLRTMRLFSSDLIRIKVFLRDDILNEIVSGPEGFTALTHITSRKADTLQWSPDQILTMITKRLFASNDIANFFDVDQNRLDASLEYRKDAFYKLFPLTVHKGSRQSNTLNWICNHTADGNGVITPRDIIDLLISAIQYQQNLFQSDRLGVSQWLIGSQAIQYGYSELSKKKLITYLKAEFPHLTENIEKFTGGKTDYTELALRKLLGRNYKEIVSHLTSIGFLNKSKDSSIYRIPYIYRKCLMVTRGSAEN